MADVVVLGSINMDITVMLDEYPDAGESIFVKSVSMAGGGKGANQAVAVRKQGVDVAFISAVGDDAQGKQMLANLRNYDVDTQWVRVDPAYGTGTAVPIVDATGENTILVCQGVNAHIKAEQVRDALLGGNEPGVGTHPGIEAKVLLAQMETNDESVLEALRLGKELGMFTILDPAPADGFFPEALAYADVVLPNHQETERITGIDVRSEADAISAAKAIERLGVPRAVVKMGSKGSVVYEGGTAVHVPAMEVDAVDTVGAGDTFAGALAAEYARTGDLLASVRYGTVAAGLKVAAGSGHPSIPYEAQVRAELARLGW